MPDLDARRVGAGRARRCAGLVVALTFAALAAVPSASFGDTLADRQAEADQIEAELVQLDADLEHAIEAYNEANSRLEQTEKRIDENTTRLQITRNNLEVAQ